MIVWTGGDSDELVTARFVEHLGYEDYWSYGTSAPASAGKLSMSTTFEEGAAERLKTNPDKAEAVQYATAELRKKYAHPFYWAPFVLVGKYR